MRSLRVLLARVVAFGIIYSDATDRLQAVAARDEDANGDPSNIGAAPPSPILLGGVNPVTADPPVSEFDFLAINVSADRELRALALSSYASTVGTSFISIKVGTTISVTNDAATSDEHAHTGDGLENVTFLLSHAASPRRDESTHKPWAKFQGQFHRGASCGEV